MHHARYLTVSQNSDVFTPRGTRYRRHEAGQGPVKVGDYLENASSTTNLNFQRFPGTSTNESKPNLLTAGDYPDGIQEHGAPMSESSFNYNFYNTQPVTIHDFRSENIKIYDVPVSAS